ncbi:MAG TPA: hypothetical protein VG944_16130 [Fimbriimonas sp.]|nr:hypothetical protein [Fimbriimonas sp.]
MSAGYRCVAEGLTGFVQQVAVSYVKNGYWFYVAGAVPSGKSLSTVDAKFVKLYDLSISKYVRCRRRKTGEAGVQYIRLGRFFLLLATHGEHLFFAREKKMIRDARRQPIRVGGYSISYRNGRASVRIERTEYRLLKDAFVRRSLNAKTRLEGAFAALPYEPYGPVRSQLLGLLRAVNRRRAVAGLPLVDRTCVRLVRRIVRPFGDG